MENTPNYNMNLPDYEDFADIEKLNENFELIDTQMKSTEDELTTHMEDEDAHGLNKYYSLEHAQTIQSYTNLDDTKTLGNYVSNSAAVTNTLLNCPISGTGFVMKVERTTGDAINFLRQTIKINHQKPRTFERSMVNNLFSPWHEITITSGLTWIEATPQNGWQQPVSSYMRLKFAKDTLGIVHVQGEVVGGITTPNTIVTTFPINYRPVTTIPLRAVRADDGSNLVMQIDNGGAMFLNSLSSTGTLRISGSFYAGV